MKDKSAIQKLEISKKDKEIKELNSRLQHAMKLKEENNQLREVNNDTKNRLNESERQKQILEKEIEQQSHKIKEFMRDREENYVYRQDQGNLQTEVAKLNDEIESQVVTIKSLKAVVERDKTSEKTS